MAYFRCTSGGSGKGNTVTVTCDSEFAGQTITLAKTGKSYSKTCPSTSPYTVTFYGIEAGTYTVSCTVSGDTYSETVIVQDVSAVLNYGFKWQTWVDTAQYLDSTDYSTLSDVLADEEAVRELFTEHATVDYMASVTSADANVTAILNDNYAAKWINLRDYALDTLYANSALASVMDTADKYFYGEWVITDSTTTPVTWGAKGNVPIMTANNAPYGEASASYAQSGCEAYKAFNNDDTDYWNTWGASEPTVNQYIRYRFTNPTCVKSVSIYPRYDDGARVKNFKVQASNDGSTWTDLYSGQCPNEKIITRFNFDNSNYYLYYQVLVLDSWYGNIAIYTLQFYGRELSVSVPVMTSNTAPYGVASASTEFSATYAAWKAFNGDLATFWQPTGTNGSTIEYEFTSKMVIKACILTNTNHGNDANYFVKNFDIEGANDGNYESIEQSLETTSKAASFSQAFELTNNKEYKKYRLKVNSSWAGSGVTLGGLQFYGLDYSEKEFETGTTKKWLYDHGVELESIEERKGSSGDNIITKESNQIYFKNGASTGTTRYAQIMFTIDTTPYSLARVKIGNKMMSTVNGVVSLSFANNVALFPSNGTENDTLKIASLGFIDGNSNLPNASGVDISNVNCSYIFFGTEYNANQYGALTELWLE